MVAPVLPALTMAEALPSRTASAARTSEESFMVRTLLAGSASMAMTSDAGDDLEAAGVAELVGAADEHDGDAELVARRAMAPATISPGALSPPMASTAMGRRSAVGHRVPAGRGSVDVDGLAAVVPAAVAAHDVGQLGGAAAGADAAGRAP